jgi:hypothetical protein
MRDVLLLKEKFTGPVEAIRERSAHVAAIPARRNGPVLQVGRLGKTLFKLMEYWDRRRLVLEPEFRLMRT